MSLLPDNTLIGSQDELPGLEGTAMPGKLEALSTLKPSDMQTIYAHNVRISSLVELEQTFAAYLKDWRAFPQEPGKEAVGKPVIIERRLSVSPHNTWRIIGGESFVSLNREEGKSGNFHSSGSLKVLNYPVHPGVALVFKLEYRGKCASSLFHSRVCRGIHREEGDPGLCHRLVPLRPADQQPGWQAAQRGGSPARLDSRSRRKHLRGRPLGPVRSTQGQKAVSNRTLSLVL